MGSHSPSIENQSMDAGKIIITIILCAICMGCAPTTVTPTTLPASISPVTITIPFTIVKGDSEGISVIRWNTTISNPDQITTNITIEVIASNTQNATIAADDITVKIGPLETIKIQHEFDVPTHVANDIAKLTRNVVWERED